MHFSATPNHRLHFPLLSLAQTQLGKMLRTQVHGARPVETPVLLPQPFLHGSGKASFPLRSNKKNMQKRRKFRLTYAAGNIKAVATVPGAAAVSVKAIITVKAQGLFADLGINRGLDDITDLLGKSILLELVSEEVNQDGSEKALIRSYAYKVSQDEEDVKYETVFKVPPDYGQIGAVVVENQHHKEMFLKQIVLDGISSTPIIFDCNSWIQSKFDEPNHKRIFFTNKSYLPSETPAGLRLYREKDLLILRGAGLEQEELKSFERVYDYAMYNDLGDPDKSPELTRPVLGGKKHPYPRRCRTGRPRSKIDPAAEVRSSNVYVPRDEEFSSVKTLSFTGSAVSQVLHALLPTLETSLVDPKLGFPYFTKIDLLFYEGLNVLPPPKQRSSLKRLLPAKLWKQVNRVVDDIVRFDPPDPMTRDKFFWFRVDEFARQTLAGLNPYSISLVTEWPLKSKLDPEIYGPPESAITTQMIEEEIGGYMTVEEAIQKKKLFILDYHDLLLPYVQKVREIEGTTLYGSRTLFFLKPDQTLKTLAIELTCPPIDGKPQWKEVFRPSDEATGVWLWRLAQSHVVAHDFGYHELVAHWLRTHGCTEPYIIAAHRQLSAMHPIFRLLKPHFRYTMKINALARLALINADGIIETSFSPAKYSMELSSKAYDLLWQFNLQGLPADLIHRGLAVEDPTEPHGLKLAIKDYPFANDGLILWDGLKEWISDYVNYYYSDDRAVQSDEELQAWWTEIRTVGHADKKDEPWWPVLKTRADLIEIIATIAWVSAGQHAAVNFGQYDYGGYFPNKHSIARINMPTENPDELFWKNFIEKPEGALLQCLPSQIQATKVMAILSILSTHSPDEEYVGEFTAPSWNANPVIKAAYERFSGRMKEMEKIIDERNADRKLKNRHGAGVLPYELLKPFSGPGVTGKGVPFSISI